MYVPGIQPKMLAAAGVYGADIVVLDLEDSVPADRKDEARDLVAETIRSMDFGRSAVFVRVNPERELAEEDIKVLTPDCAGILFPKCESVDQIRFLDAVFDRMEGDLGIENGHFKIIPIIESALGLTRAAEIAVSEERIVAMTLGVEDLSADLGMVGPDENALLFAKSTIVIAARSAGIEPLDSVFSNIDDTEGLIGACRRSRSLGFSGRGAIHPNQVETIHAAFAPEAEEVEKARRIVEAAEEGEAAGLGAVKVDGAMVDLPVVKRARRVLEAATAPGPVLDLSPGTVDASDAEVEE